MLRTRERPVCNRCNVERDSGASCPESDYPRSEAIGPLVAREVGTFTLTAKGTSPKEISGKYLVLGQRVQGD
jgi:hypothetical protein